MKSIVRTTTIDLLRSLGLTTVFGNPGSTELGFLQDWPVDFRYVLGLNEGSVVAMADGYAQARRDAAFVNLHSAAGVGHAGASIYTAFRNQTPLVITAGQQSRSLLPLRPFLGSTDAAQLPKPYVKWSVEPARPEDVPLAIAQAYTIAMQRPCGPTFVSVPADDWHVEAAPVSLQAKSRAFGPDLVMLRDFADRLNASRNPVIVAGAAIAREGAVDAAVALAESLNAAVWAAPLWSRAGFPEDHPNFAGFLPAAPDTLHQLLRAHDIVLVLGAPAFTLHVAGELAPLRTDLSVLHITDDADSAAATVTGRSLLSSLGPALEALMPLLKPVSRPKPTGRALPEHVPVADPIPADLLMQTIAELRPPASVIVEEAPSHKVAIQNFLPVRRGDDFYSIASGSLGWGLPASVGVALANPKRRVIAVIGDGSMMYSIQALWSAAQLRLPLTIVVPNNGGYGAMRAFSQSNSGPPPGIELLGLDFIALAAGHGVQGVRVSRADALADALSDALAADHPHLVEVIVDRTVQKMYTLDRKP